MRKFQAHKLLLTILTVISLLFETPDFYSAASSSIVNAASPVTATFALVDENAFLKMYPYVSLASNCFTVVGTGKINYSNMILNNPTAANKAIVNSPPGANYNWKHVVYYQGKYYVGAPLTTNSSQSKKETAKNTPINNKTSTSSTHLLTRSQMLSLKSSDYPSNDSVKWVDYRIGDKDVFDGVIPVSLINDPVYTSMNLPSESRSSVMIDAWRDNGHICGSTSVSGGTRLLHFGAIEVTDSATLPDNFSVYLGKIKMFAYSKSKQKWITLDANAYPQGEIRLYTLPWNTTTATKCNNITYSNNYVKVDLTKKELQNCCLHFWGKSVPLNNSDYLYYASSYEVWVSNNAVGKLTASSGIDVKDDKAKTTYSQLFTSRGISCASYSKSVWGTTIPNNVYKAQWGKDIQALYSQQIK